MRTCRSAALGATAVILGASSGALQAQIGLIGSWSPDQSCATEAPRMVFGTATLELRERNQRIFLGNVSFATSDNQTAVTVMSIASIAAEVAQLPRMPAIGDVATYRREGDRVFPVSYIRNGETRNAPPDVRPFYLCR